MAEETTAYRAVSDELHAAINARDRIKKQVLHRKVSPDQLMAAERRLEEAKKAFRAHNRALGFRVA